MSDRDVWRSVAMTNGAQFVMTYGTQVMLKLCAISWDTEEKVYQ